MCEGDMPGPTKITQDAAQRPICAELKHNVVRLYVPVDYTVVMKDRNSRKYMRHHGTHLRAGRAKAPGMHQVL